MFDCRRLIVEYYELLALNLVSGFGVGFYVLDLEGCKLVGVISWS